MSKGFSNIQGAEPVENQAVRIREKFRDQVYFYYANFPTPVAMEYVEKVADQYAQEMMKRLLRSLNDETYILTT